MCKTSLAYVRPWLKTANKAGVFKRLGQLIHAFVASLAYIVTACLNKTKRAGMQYGYREAARHVQDAGFHPRTAKKSLNSGSTCFYTLPRAHKCGSQARMATAPVSVG